MPSCLDLSPQNNCMESDTKKIIGTLAIAGAATGGYFLYKKGIKIFSAAKMNFALLGFRIHKMNIQEVQFAVSMRCYNPTSSPITIAINQVVANYKGSAIAFSKPDMNGFEVASGSKEEPEISFQVPYLNLLGKGLTLSALQNKTQLMADMSFTLTVNINGETVTTTQNLSDESMSGIPIGQLGIVSGPRDTKDGTQYNHLIKKSRGKEIFIENGNVIETVESCIDIVENNHKEVESLAKSLQSNTLKNTCRNIFNFAYSFLQYKLDKAGTEQLRTPARSWQDGQIEFKQKGDTSQGIDCDDFSIFCGSILKCLGIPFKFRITKYDGRDNFQHIYVFVPDEGDSEDEIVIDPVLSKFDYQKPYSYEKSFNGTSPVLRAVANKGIDGMFGTVGLGLPIYALSGVDTNDDDYSEMMGIVSGVDFEETINGLGSPEDETLNYLIRTRDYLTKNTANKNKMAHVQNPDQFVSMLNQAIKFWNTPQRESVLNKLILIEDKLLEKGYIKYDAEAINGFEEDEDDESDYLGGRSARKAKRKKRRAKFFSAVKSVAKKTGGVAKKVVKAVVRFNPLTVAIRGGLLAALRINMFGISKKLHYAYLPESMASKHNIDLTKLRDLKKRHAKVKKLFKGLQGKEKNLKKAILKGAKQKSTDFSLNGVETALQALSEIEGLSGFGDLGVVATAASVGAASGVLATIKTWLNPVKNMFSNVRGKIAQKKVENKTEKGQTISDKLKQRAQEYVQSQQIVPVATSSTSVANETPSTEYSIAPEAYQSTITPTNNATLPTKKGLSKTAKIGIGIGALAILGGGAYYLSQQGKNKKVKKASKASLGRIQLN